MVESLVDTRRGQKVGGYGLHCGAAVLEGEDVVGAHMDVVGCGAGEADKGVVAFGDNNPVAFSWSTTGGGDGYLPGGLVGETGGVGLPDSADGGVGDGVAVEVDDGGHGVVHGEDQGGPGRVGADVGAVVVDVEVVGVAGQKVVEIKAVDGGVVVRDIAIECAFVERGVGEEASEVVGLAKAGASVDPFDGCCGAAGDDGGDGVGDTAFGSRMHLAVDPLAGAVVVTEPVVAVGADVDMVERIVEEAGGGEGGVGARVGNLAGVVVEVVDFGGGHDDVATDGIVAVGGGPADGDVMLVDVAESDVPHSGAGGVVDTQGGHELG